MVMLSADWVVVKYELDTAGARPFLCCRARVSAVFDGCVPPYHGPRTSAAHVGPARG